MSLKQIAFVIALMFVAIGFYLVNDVEGNLNLGEFGLIVFHFFGSLFGLIFNRGDINHIDWLWFSVGQAVQLVVVYFVVHKLLVLLAKETERNIKS